MSETMKSEHRVHTTHSTVAGGEQPSVIQLALAVTDPEVIGELAQYAAGPARDEYATQALRLGVLALRQARGQVDSDAVRRESERLLENLQHRLEDHSRTVHDRLAGSLKEYFDPGNGRFQERVERLIKRDGELEQVLRRQLGQEESELSRTLALHIGADSPLMKWLNPDQSQGLLAALEKTLATQLESQREQVLGQFSLDNKEGALARFVAELSDRQGKLSDDLQGRIEQLRKQFSLDEDDSALSRLVQNVQTAQRTITREFSLDEDTSALSRLKRVIENTNQTIHSSLSLDDEKSALARLRKELTGILEQQQKQHHEFQQEVTASLSAMVARRAEADGSTRHGLDFERAVFELLQREAQRSHDIAEATGNSTGRIKNAKVGDAVIELGPDSAAPGGRIVVEANEHASYQLPQAREEIEQARHNRDAQVGLFVFSKKTAPEGMEPLLRYGNDIFVVWDFDDEASDLYLKAGLTLARALCVRKTQTSAEQTADFESIDVDILEVEKRAAQLDDIEN